MHPLALHSKFLIDTKYYLPSICSFVERRGKCVLLSIPKRHPRKYEFQVMKGEKSFQNATFIVYLYQYLAHLDHSQYYYWHLAHVENLTKHRKDEHLIIVKSVFTD